MDRIGLSFVFNVEDLPEQILWLFDKLKEAEVNGYKPVSIQSDEMYTWNHPGKAKLLVICEGNKHAYTDI